MRVSGVSTRVPTRELQVIPLVWLLAKWGIDIVGPLPKAQGSLAFAIVAVEYFTRWVEAEPVASITTQSVIKFFWKNIVCRFGVLKELTLDNGPQFSSSAFKEYCERLGTRLCFALAYHPQTNSAVERQNCNIFSPSRK